MNFHELIAAARPLASGAPLALLLFAGLLTLCMLPAGYGVHYDRRTIRGVNVWVKPLKFVAALALFAATTAVLMLAVGEGRTGVDNAGAPLDAIAALVIATASFEAGYIALQASRAQESHYNNSDGLHMALNVLMALGAVGLTGSQLWLALAIMRTQPGWTASAPLAGVVAGLVLTFVLATVSGFMLGGRRAPPGPGMAVVGWHKRADLRPAHFLGVHAQQAIPAFGLLAHGLSRQAPVALLAALTGAYVLAFVLAVAYEWRAAPQRLREVTGDTA